MSPPVRSSARIATVAGAVVVTLASMGGTAIASSHAEAPYIKQRPKLDGTDFYAFASYEPGRENYITLIANYQPLQDAYGGPNYFAMDPDAIYEIHVDNDGDAVEDLTFLFDFDNSLNNGGQGLALQIGDQSVPVALKHIGPLGTGDNQGVINVNETYYVGMTLGPRRAQSPVWAARPDSGLRILTKPYDNAGQKSFPAGYDAFVASTTNSGQTYYDVNFDQCPDGARSGRVFAGQRKDSFSIALGDVFDLVNLVPLASATPDDAARDDLADKNISTLAVEVHKDCLTGDGNGTIGAWTTSSIRATETISQDPTFQQPTERRGEFRQVSRLGSPLVNEVVIGLPDKNAFNASEPSGDGQFATYVTNPTLPAILDILFRDAVGADSNIAPSNLPRLDLVTAFLTGFEGVNQLATVTPSEMLRLNTAIPATPKDEQVNLGVAGGDLAGFPNGRRPGDDVTDIALRVVMGALCHPIAVDLDANGTAGDAGDNLGLCAPVDAPVGTAPFTDGVPQNAAQFDNAFPYLTTPIPGSPSGMQTEAADAGGSEPMMPADGMTGDTAGDMIGDMMPGESCPVDPSSISSGAVSSTALELSWDMTTGIEQYEVFVDGALFQVTDRPNVSIDGLDPGTAYLVEVVPLDADGTRFTCVPAVMLTTSS